MTERERALEIYEMCCRTLDENDWKYERREEDLVILLKVQGEDLPLNMIIRIAEKKSVLQFICVLPFKFSEEKRVEGALAVSIANYGMINGAFDFDLNDGEIRFRLTQSYAMDNNISPELFLLLMALALGTTDKYDDRFFALEKDLLSLEDFAKKDRE